MGATEPMTGLPQPPPERELPDSLRHRRELLAVITAGRPLPRASRWVIPAGAAAAVAAIAITAAALVPVFGHRAAPGGRPAATATGGGGTACQAPGGTECQLTESFTAAAPAGGLTVLDGVGSVTITGSDRDSVRVTERLAYRGYPPVITRSDNGGVLTLSYRCRPSDCGDSYDIEVPRSLAVRVVTGTGPISLASLAGQVHASTDVGDIHGQDLSSTLAEFRTGVGSIEAGFTSAPSQLAANTGTGSARLLVPPGPGYHVTASSRLGSVSISVRQDTSSGHVIQATAGVGSVTIAAG